MNGANDEWDECTVCGRTILRGERAWIYIDQEGERAEVCPLCKPRAEASGWLPEEFASTRPAEPQRRRRGPAVLRERLARTMATVTAAPEPAEPPPSPPSPPSPIEVFNGSSEVARSRRCASRSATRASAFVAAVAGRGR